MLSGEGRLLNDQSDGTTLTAGIIVLLIGLELYRLSDAVAAKEERRKSRYGRISATMPAMRSTRRIRSAGHERQNKKPAGAANTGEPTGR